MTDEININFSDEDTLVINFSDDQEININFDEYEITDNITGHLVPYEGAIANLDLGAYDINAADGIFTGNVTADSLTVYGEISATNLSGINTGDQDLTGYELLSNKSTDTALGTSDTLYPTQNATKIYVDTEVGAIDFWDRTGTVLSPKISGDDISTVGNVGIGTATPTEKLEVNGNIFLNGDNVKFMLGAGKDSSIYYDGTDMIINPQEIGSGSLKVLGDLIIPNGNVGIGTESPVAPLHVVYTGGDGINPFRVDAIDSTISEFPAFKVNLPTTGSRKGFQIANGNDVYAWASFAFADSRANSKPGLALGQGGSSSRDTVLYRDSANKWRTPDDFIIDGNVGIGITSPTEKLEVNGNLYLKEDNNKLLFGAGKDSSIYYDGSDMIFNPKEVGSGQLKVLGDLNVTGTISNSLSHMHSLSTDIGLVNAVDTWYNVTFNSSLGDVENLEILTDNRTLVIDHDGHYTIGFGMGFQDDSPSPNADVGMRLTRNGIEIPGSYIESDTTKQNADVWAEHTTHTELSAGDMINMQYISSDTDVTIQQHDTYATQPFNAYGYLQEVIV